MNQTPVPVVRYLKNNHGRRSVPILAVVGLSNSGKTTLMEKLIRVLTRGGLRVGTIKHDVHGFDMDRPGKDSWRHKNAGAATTIISSPQQVGIVRDVCHDHHPDELLPLLKDMDLVLLEGYKNLEKPKVEVFRSSVAPEPLCLNDPHLIAIASDVQLNIDVPCFPLENAAGLAELVIARFGLEARFFDAAESQKVCRP